MTTKIISRGEAIALAKTVITQMHGVESDEFQKIVDELSAMGFNKIPIPSKEMYNEIYSKYCIIVALNPIGKSGKEIKNSYEFEQACENKDNQLFVWYSSPVEIKKLSSKHMSIGRRWVSNNESRVFFHSGFFYTIYKNNLTYLVSDRLMQLYYLSKQFQTFSTSNFYSHKIS